MQGDVNMLFFPTRASDPEEIYKIQEVKMKRDRVVGQEDQLDHLIQLCKQELTLLMENQENWQYPLVHACGECVVCSWV